MLPELPPALEAFLYDTQGGGSFIPLYSREDGALQRWVSIQESFVALPDVDAAIDFGALPQNEGAARQGWDRRGGERRRTTRRARRGGAPLPCVRAEALLCLVPQAAGRPGRLGAHRLGGQVEAAGSRPGWGAVHDGPRGCRVDSARTLGRWRPGVHVRFHSSRALRPAVKAPPELCPQPCLEPPSARFPERSFLSPHPHTHTHTHTHPPTHTHAHAPQGAAAA